MRVACRLWAANPPPRVRIARPPPIFESDFDRIFLGWRMTSANPRPGPDEFVPN